MCGHVGAGGVGRELGGTLVAVGGYRGRGCWGAPARCGGVPKLRESSALPRLEAFLMAVGGGVPRLKVGLGGGSDGLRGGPQAGKGSWWV